MDETPKVEVTAPNPQPQVTTSPPHHKFPKFALLAFVLLLFATFGGSMVLFYQNQSPQTQPTSTTVSPTTTPQTAGSVENWKTYRNEEYGFEFKYPAYYLLNGDDSFTANPISHLGLQRCSRPDFNFPRDCDTSEFIQIYVEVFNDSSMAEEKLRQYTNRKVSFGECILDEELITRTQFEINGHLAHSINYNISDLLDGCTTLPEGITIQLGDETKSYIHKNNRIYQLNSIAFSENKETETKLRQELDQILSTFQFIESMQQSADTAFWKTYTNPQHGFSIKYPHNKSVKIETQQTNTLLETDKKADVEFIIFPQGETQDENNMHFSGDFVMSIGILKNVGEVNPEAYIQKFYAEENPDIQHIKVGELSGIVFAPLGMGYQKEVVFKHGSNLYFLHGFSEKPIPQQFTDMTATFKISEIQ